MRTSWKIRTSWKAHSLLVVALAGALGATALGAPTQAASSSTCVVAGATDAGTAKLRMAAGARDAEGVYAYQHWLTTAPAQAARQMEQRTVDAALRIPAKPKVRSSDLLSRGLVGYTVDHANQSLVAVVTSDFTGATALAAELKRAQASLLGSFSAAPVLRVQAGCFTATSLIDAERVLFGRAWHPDAAKAAFSAWLNPADSRFHVTVDYHYPQVAQALADALGDRVAVELGEAARAGRLNDGNPHYGGSGIRVGYSSNTDSNTCTSGFEIRRNANGKLGMTAAGHCFANSDSIYSSTQYYGSAWDKFSFPSLDAMTVISTSETYDNVIHTEPCSPCTRTVTAKGTAGAGGYVCLSGMVTQAICSVYVESTSASICDSYGCTYGLMQGYRNGDTIVRPGDSGGPVYARTGTASATALASIVGGVGSRTSTSTRVLAEHVTSIEDLLDVTVLTS
jgi:hypothetical protein